MTERCTCGYVNSKAVPYCDHCGRALSHVYCGGCERPVGLCECLDICRVCGEEDCDGHDYIPF